MRYLSWLLEAQKLFFRLFRTVLLLTSLHESNDGVCIKSQLIQKFLSLFKIMTHFSTFYKGVSIVNASVSAPLMKRLNSEFKSLLN